MLPYNTKDTHIVSICYTHINITINIDKIINKNDLIIIEITFNNNKLLLLLLLLPLLSTAYITMCIY